MVKHAREIQFPQWLSKREAAKYLGISRRTLDYWTAEKPPRVGYVKLGNEKRFILTDLERFKEAHTVKAA
jgi:excisionase family DNA binding protein